MTAYVVVRLIIPTAVQQLKLSCPVILPTHWQVVVAEVGEVNEIVSATLGIEACSQAQIQDAHTLLLVLVDSIKLPALIAQIRLQYPLDTTLVVGCECRTFLPRTQPDG